MLAVNTSCSNKPGKIQPSFFPGKWIEGQDTSIFLNNGVYIYIRHGFGRDTSFWKYKDGILTLTPQPFGIEREYNVLDSDRNLFTYRCTNINIDDSVYTAKRVH